MERLFRHATFERKAVDPKTRTARMVFSSEEPVGRDGYKEVLGHGPGEADLSRLNNGGPLCLNHDHSTLIGVVLSANIERDGSGRMVGRATVKFGNTTEAKEIFEDVLQGIRKNVSVGYSTTKVISREKNHVRFAWQALEISLVSVPADATCGIGRSKGDECEECDGTGIDQGDSDQGDSDKGDRSHSISILNENKYKYMNSEETKEIIAVTRAVSHDRPDLEMELKNLSARAIASDQNGRDYKRSVMSLLDQNPKAPNQRVLVGDFEVGMSKREREKWSLTRAINGYADNKRWDGFELDVSQQVEKNSGMRAEGLLVPLDVMLGGSRREYAQRDLTVGNFNQAGAFVQSDVVTPIIELYRNRTVCARLGATVLSGLQGNVLLPRQKSSTAAQSVPETASLVDGNATVDQVAMTPKRVGATTTFSKQLLIQSSVDVENFVRGDCMQSVAVKHDYLAIAGQGSNSEPLGILNTPGIGSVTFGGTATWSKIVDFETIVAGLNADAGRLAYLTSPNVRGSWKKIAVALTGATTVSTRQLWEEGDYNDGTNDGKVNSYRAAYTNNVPNNNVLYGNWQDLLIGLWGSFDLCVDPYTLAKKAEVVVTLNSFIDTALRHAESFVASADAGNQ